MKTSGNTILITGATAGIGLALTRVFLGAGNTVIGIGRNMESLQRLQHDGNLFPWPCDLLTTSLNDLAQSILQRFPKINVFINNAGIQYNYTSLQTSIPETRIEEELYLNLEVPIQLTNQLLPHFFSQQESVIVNITTSLTMAPKRSAPFYCAAKAGLQTYTRVLRYHCENSKVRVMEVVPPLVDTNMTRDRRVGKISPDVVAKEILRGMQNDEEIIYIGKARLLRALMRIAPSVGYRLMKNN